MVVCVHLCMKPIVITNANISKAFEEVVIFFAYALCFVFLVLTVHYYYFKFWLVEIVQSLFIKVFNSVLRWIILLIIILNHTINYVFQILFVVCWAKSSKYINVFLFFYTITLNQFPGIICYCMHS